MNISYYSFPYMDVYYHKFARFSFESNGEGFATVKMKSKELEESCSTPFLKAYSMTRVYCHEIVYD